MKKYKVREHFNVLLNEEAHEAGSVLELTEEEAALYAHQIEEVVKAKAKASAE